jgi:phosphatidylglycerol:prolipoprotein diacylglycerol transferase
MRQDLFHIPHQWLGIPVFGAGWLLILWAAASLVLLVYLWRRQGWSADTRSYLPLLALMGLLIWLVLPRLEEIADAGLPRGLPIRGYGVMLLLGVLAGVGLAVREARRVGMDPDMVISLCFHLFVWGIVGARLFYVVEYWPQFSRPTPLQTLGAVVNVTEGGLVVYGSLIGALAGGLWFLRRHALPMLAMADLMAPSLVLGLALGRLGCFLNGCCYGGVCDASWAVTFPNASEPYAHQRSLGQLHGFRLAEDADGHAPRVVAVEAGGPAAAAGLQAGDIVRAVEGRQVDSFGQARELLRISPPQLQLTTDRGDVTIRLSALPQRSRPAHPTQVYAAVGAALLCWLLWSYYPFRGRDGEVFAVLLTLYPVMRFLEEAIRVDEPGRFRTSFSIAQWISLLLLAGVAGLWIHVLRQPQGSALAVARNEADSLP